MNRRNFFSGIVGLGLMSAKIEAKPNVLTYQNPTQTIDLGSQTFEGVAETIEIRTGVTANNPVGLALFRHNTEQADVMFSDLEPSICFKKLRSTDVAYPLSVAIIYGTDDPEKFNKYKSISLKEGIMYSVKLPKGTRIKAATLYSSDLTDTINKQYKKGG